MPRASGAEGSTPSSSAMNKIQTAVKKYSQLKGYDKQSLEQVFLLLTEEIGELAKAARKTVGMKIGTHSRDPHAGEEVADIMYVLSEICNRLGIDFEKEFAKKMKIIKKRK